MSCDDDDDDDDDGSPDGADDGRVAGHAEVVVAAPHGHVPPALGEFGRRRKLLGAAQNLTTPPGHGSGH